MASIKIRAVGLGSRSTVLWEAQFPTGDKSKSTKAMRSASKKARELAIKFQDVVEIQVSNPPHSGTMYVAGINRTTAIEYKDGDKYLWKIQADGSRVQATPNQSEKAMAMFSYYE